MHRPFVRGAGPVQSPSMRRWANSEPSKPPRAPYVDEKDLEWVLSPTGQQQFASDTDFRRRPAHAFYIEDDKKHSRARLWSPSMRRWASDADLHGHPVYWAEGGFGRAALPALKFNITTNSMYLPIGL